MGYYDRKVAEVTVEKNRKMLHKVLWIVVLVIFLGNAHYYMEKRISWLESACSEQKEHCDKCFSELNELREKVKALQKEVQYLNLKKAKVEPKPTSMKKKNANGKSLAIQNNNPLNVKRAGEKWLGQVGIDKEGHVIFSKPEYGVRAGANVLVSYYMNHKLDTIEGIIKRFCKGNTKDYISFVSSRLRMPPNKKFDVTARLPELLAAMARFESSVEWDPEYFAPYSVVHAALKKAKN